MNRRVLKSGLALLLLPFNCLIVRRKFQADAVDAVSLICGCGVPFPFENMAQVSAAVGTDNLGSFHTPRAVGVASHGTRDAVKVRGPAAAGLELVVGLVQRSFTASTGVDTVIREELVVLSGARSLGALLPQDSELLCNELVT